MYPTPTPWWKKLFFATEVFIGINLVVLDIYLMHQYTHTQVQPTFSGNQQVVSAPLSPTSAVPTVTTFPSTPTPTSISKIVNAQPAVKEYFIPLGAGQGSYTDWTTVPGLQALVDKANYPNIKQVTFEATVRVPNANQSVQVRLLNSTDGHPVWFSDLSFSGTADGEFKVSQNISLDNGAKTYVVQLKTQLGSLASIDQARIHITLR